MQITKLLRSDEDRAVSPVIGVILMVAVTVILAAVIGTFVLGLGDQAQETAPNAQFDFNYQADGGDVDGDDALTITHDGGSSVPVSQTRIVSANVDLESANAGEGLIEDPDVTSDLTFDTTGDVSAGTGGTIDESTGTGYSTSQTLAGDTIRVVWTSEGGDQSNAMADWEGPDA